MIKPLQNQFRFKYQLLLNNARLDKPEAASKMAETLFENMHGVIQMQSKCNVDKPESNTAT